MFKLEYHGHFEDGLVIVQYEPGIFRRRIKHKLYLLKNYTLPCLTGLDRLTFSELFDLLSYLKKLEPTYDIYLCIKEVEDQINWMLQFKKNGFAMLKGAEKHENKNKQQKTKKSKVD